MDSGHGPISGPGGGTGSSAGQAPPAPTRVALCLPIRGTGSDAQVLLGLKRRGFGAGRIVAPGGKLEPGETDRETAVRELEEETGMLASPSGIRPAGHVRFRFPADPAADMDCSVFLSPTTGGTPRTTDELDPVWYPTAGLPLDSMWEDSAHWLRPMLDGAIIDVDVILADDNVSVAEIHIRT